MGTKEQILFSTYLWDMPNISSSKFYKILNSISFYNLERNNTPEAIAIKVVINRANSLDDLKKFFSQKEYKKMSKFYEKLHKEELDHNKKNINICNSETNIKVINNKKTIDLTNSYKVYNENINELILNKEDFNTLFKKTNNIQTNLLEEEIKKTKEKEIAPVRIANPLNFAKKMHD